MQIFLLGELPRLFQDVINSLNHKLYFCSNVQMVVEKASGVGPALVVLAPLKSNRDLLDALREVRSAPCGEQMVVLGILHQDSISDIQQCIDAGLDMCIDQEASVKQVTMVWANATRAAILRYERGRMEPALLRMVENVPAVIYQTTLDVEASMFYVSPQIEAMLGYAVSEWLEDATLWVGRMHPEDRDRVRSVIATAHKREKNFTCEYRLLDRKNKVLWVRDQAALVYKENGDPMCWQGLLYDISDMKQTQERLARSKALALGILETAKEAIITIDQCGIIREANPASERMFGYTHDELLGSNVTLIMPERFESSHNKYFKTFLETGRPSVLGIIREVEGLHKDGFEFPLEISLAEIDLDERVFTGVLRDITQKKMLERTILETSERERQAIGMEIHDDLGQLLTSAIFMVHAMKSNLGNERAAEVTRISEVLGVAGRKAQQLARGLWPVFTEGSSISQALGALCQNIQEQFDIICSFEDKGTLEFSERSLANHICRIVQDASINAMRHGHAKEINVKLAVEDEWIELRIENDGDPIQDNVDDITGMGLRNIRWRTEVLGGKLELKPLCSGGTVLVCRFRASQLERIAEEE